MNESTFTKTGNTKIPEEVQKALKMKPGDKIHYEIKGNSATIRVHPGAASFAGALSIQKLAAEKVNHGHRAMQNTDTNDEQALMSLGGSLKSKRKGRAPSIKQLRAEAAKTFARGWAQKLAK